MAAPSKTCLRPCFCLYCGFESHRGHDCLSKTSSTDSGVCVCVCEFDCGGCIIRRPWPIGRYCTMENKTNPSLLRVVKSRRMRWAGHVARMGEDRVVHRVLVGKPEGKRSLGRPRRRWEDNIKMDLQEVGGGRGDWMELGQDRDGWRALVGTVRNFQVA